MRGSRNGSEYYPIGRRPAKPTPLDSHTRPLNEGTSDVCCWQILLQKSFCITDCKFSGPYVRRSNNHLRGYIKLRWTHRRLRERPGGYIALRFRLGLSIFAKMSPQHFSSFVTHTRLH